MLIVQSPGIDRVLKTDREFRVFAGQKVIVQTKEKLQDLGVKFVAVLLVATPEEIKLAHPKPLQTKTSKTAKATSKGVAKASLEFGTDQPASHSGSEAISAGSEHKDISLSRAVVSEVRLFAPDLQPKNT
jgi:hypothetical protein